jgi:invasion protein IalB
LQVFHFSKTCVTAALALLALTAPTRAQEADSTLPGGASSLQEAYQDWNLACQSAPKIVCAISQQQTQQNGQRVLAIEFSKSSDDSLTGNLVLPFGLLLDAGAVLQIDDAPPQTPLKFSTCRPVGCVVPLSFDPVTADALRAGTALRVKVQSTDMKELAFSISLKGLAAALDRLRVLTGA